MRKKRALWFLPLLPVAGLVIVTALASPAQSVPSYGSACSGCHTADAAVSISVTTASQTATTITYAVSGSDIHSAGIGWGVFNGGTKVASGSGSGQFTVPKDGTTYTVYWVDKEGGGSLAGYASTSVTAPMPTTTTTQATTTTTQATTTTTVTGTTGTTAPPSTTSTTITVPPATVTTIVSNDDDDDEEDEEEDEDRGPEHGDKEKEKKEKEDKHDRHESAKKDTVSEDSEHEDDED